MLTFPFPDVLCQTDTDPSEAFGVFIVTAIRTASGERAAPYEVRWGFGNGSIRNNAGSCVNLQGLWTPCKYEALVRNNPDYGAAGLRLFVVHMQAWASPGLLNFALRAMAEGRLSELHNVDYLRKQLNVTGLVPLVDVQLPVNPDDWWKHPAFASTPPKQL